MKLKEAFAKPTYRDRGPETYYGIGYFVDGKFTSFVHDTLNRLIAYGDEGSAQEWLAQRRDDRYTWQVVRIEAKYLS